MDRQNLQRRKRTDGWMAGWMGGWVDEWMVKVKVKFVLFNDATGTH